MKLANMRLRVKLDLIESAECIRRLRLIVAITYNAYANASFMNSPEEPQRQKRIGIVEKGFRST